MKRGFNKLIKSVVLTSDLVTFHDQINGNDTEKFIDLSIGYDNTGKHYMGRGFIFNNFGDPDADESMTVSVDGKEAKTIKGGGWFGFSDVRWYTMHIINTKGANFEVTIIGEVV